MVSNGILDWNIYWKDGVLMRLRTIEDFNHEDYDGLDLDAEDLLYGLKEAAIDRILHIEGYSKITDFDIGAMAMMKLFFNITEEDLG